MTATNRPRPEIDANAALSLVALTRSASKAVSIAARLREAGIAVHEDQIPFGACEPRYRVLVAEHDLARAREVLAEGTG